MKNLVSVLPILSAVPRVAKKPTVLGTDQENDDTDALSATTSLSDFPAWQ